MSENKRATFVLNFDWLRFFDKLTGDESKELIYAIFKFAQDETDTDFSDSPFLDMAWYMIKPTLAKYKHDYEETCRKRQESGKKGGRPKKEKSEETKENLLVFEKPAETNCNLKNPDSDCEYDNDSEYDSDYDNVCVNENEEKSTHTYGKYRNVFLTEKEYFSFIDAHPSDGHAIIDQLSEKITLDPEKYKLGHSVWLDIFAKNYKPPEIKKPEEKYSPPSFDVNLVLQRSLNLDPTQTKRQ